MNKYKLYRNYIKFVLGYSVNDIADFYCKDK